MDNKPDPALSDLTRARDEFVTQWGALGTTWGINRTMAQIHALLMVTPRPLTTDEVMADLQISRGNAHANLRDLVGWGLIRSVVRKGERKELFEAEKDVWKMFCTIVRERKRREVEPAIAVLKTCASQTAALRSEEARAFTTQLQVLADNVMSKIAKSEKNVAVPWALKFLK
jgi:DNA-binding transcriptional regulator GbsR (MarR family)